MDISMEDLKVALNRAQVGGFTTADDMAAFAWGYLSAGPLIEAAEAEDKIDGRIGTSVPTLEFLSAFPVGTEVQDTENDYWVQFRPGAWAWFRYGDGTLRLDPDDYYADNLILEGALPATIVKVGN